MTRVAVIGPFPPLKGGISQHTEQVARAFEAQGCTVDRHGWASQYPRILYRREQLDHSSIGVPLTSQKLRWWNPFSWWSVGRRARDADLVVLQWVTPVHALPQFVIGLIARRSQVIFHVHNVLPHEPIPTSKFMARRVLRRADHLVCHASTIAADLEGLGIEINTIVTPMSALPIGKSVAPSPLPPRPPVRLLFAGIIRHYKGLDVAIEALALVGDRLPQYELTIVGEPWSEDLVPKQSALDRLEGPVTLHLEYVSDDELVDLVARHHLLLAPYRSATQSGVVSLALAAGRPVVATRTGGLPDMIHHGRNGTLAEVEDAASFGAAIVAAIDDLDRLAAGAAETSPNWSDYAERVLGALGPARADSNSSRRKR